MTHFEILNLIDEGFNSLGLKIPTENQKTLFISHLKLLLKWNKAKNLTTITEMKEAAIKHLLDSATLLRIVFKDKKILDIGTGGGFPGIPLAILSPESSVFLMDSVGKKCSFLRAVKMELNLQNIEIIEGRAEDFEGFTQRHGKVDFTVSRAFSDTEKFLRISKPYLKEYGNALIFKVLKDEKSHGDFRLEETIDYKLPFLEQDRKIFVYRME